MSKYFHFSFAGILVLSLSSFLALPAQAKHVELKVALDKPVVLTNKKHTGYLKISLNGLEQLNIKQRPPVNISIVLDKSGSMQGEKIKQAKEAAIMAIKQMTADDIVSVITYDSTVEIIWPATKVTDKNAIIQAIKSIQTRGSTALFAGVSKGAGEVRKFLDKQNVNRVILLSDGLANVGPSSPTELAQLGMSLGKEGISVTTIGLGLGYNEDLMTDLAGYSDGNHSFAENAADLVQIFDRELSNALSVVASDAIITIQCAEGIKPLRVLGRNAEILGQDVTTRIGQLYSEQEKFVLLEVEIAANTSETKLAVADVNVSYHDIYEKRPKDLTAYATVSFSNSENIVNESQNRDVMISTVEQIAIEKSKEAIQLRDEGKIDQAQKTLKAVGGYLSTNAANLGSEKLQKQAEETKEDAEQLDEKNWNLSRKKLKAREYSRSNQSYK